MPDRRQFLAATAALPLSAALAQGAALSCPDPTPGVFANWTGTLGGSPFTPADASGHQELYTPDQWQYPLILTDKAAKAGSYGGACNRDCNNQRVKGERWILLGLGGGNTAGGEAPFPPASPEAPFRLEHDVNRYEPPGGTVGYWVLATRVIHSASNCRDSQRPASSGYVELTTYDATRVAGHLSLTWNGETVSGDFDVAACEWDWTAARPPRTCVG
jgi:hypothetical protein